MKSTGKAKEAKGASQVISGEIKPEIKEIPSSKRRLLSNE